MTTTPPEPTPRGEPPVLTEDEITALRLTQKLWEALQQITGQGATRGDDLADLRGHIRAIQLSIMGQAAARGYPRFFRLLGSVPRADV